MTMIQLKNCKQLNALQKSPSYLSHVGSQREIEGFYFKVGRPIVAGQLWTSKGNCDSIFY